MFLAAGHSYDLTTNDATVAAGKTLIVDARPLGAGDHLTFDGSAETDGRFNITGGAGDNHVTGGAQDDAFDLTLGGTDTAYGGGGDDYVLMGAFLDSGDTIDGGTEVNLQDSVYLAGDYSGANAVVFSPTTMTSIERIWFGSGYSYDLTTDDATVAAGRSARASCRRARRRRHADLRRLGGNGRQLPLPGGRGRRRADGRRAGRYVRPDPRAATTRPMAAAATMHSSSAPA